MGRFKPKKQRSTRQEQRFHVEGEPVNEAEMLATAAQIANQVDDPGRILFFDDPALQLGQVLTDLDVEARTVTYAEGESGQLPAALFEPAKAMMVRLPGQPAIEQQAHGATLLGMKKLTRGFADLTSAPGWELHRLPDDRLELRSPDKGVWSRITVPMDPAWVSAALTTGYVLCLYGTQLGVRLPPDRTPAQYTDKDRLAEFRRGREQGLTAGALVKYFNNR